MDNTAKDTASFSPPQKRKRKGDWTDDESLLFVQLYKEYTVTLSSSIKKPSISHMANQAAWANITHAIN